jgi:hypothetical protein
MFFKTGPKSPFKTIPTFVIRADVVASKGPFTKQEQTIRLKSSKGFHYGGLSSLACKY